jgi:hypothetical protein
MEILDYQQDLSKNSHQAATIKKLMLKSQVGLYTSLTHQEMLRSLSEGQFVRNIAIDTDIIGP